jgi:FKBP-type peptidyl-prolyl cis-trans isomerase
MFDSSFARNFASTFPVDRVIKGWGEGVQLMTPGQKLRLWIPQELAYAGQSGRPQGMLVFDVELVEVVPAPDKHAPPDVSAVPADADRTPSGLAYKVLRPGKGGAKPTKTSRVTVHYSGWTTDGKLFDSSLMRGQTATFGLGDVIEGWTEGLQLMVPGEKTRFWIPERLAYKGQGNGPKGMLVFDVELLADDGDHPLADLLGRRRRQLSVAVPEQVNFGYADDRGSLPQLRLAHRRKFVARRHRRFAGLSRLAARRTNERHTNLLAAILACDTGRKNALVVRMSEAEQQAVPGHHFVLLLFITPGRIALQASEPRCDSLTAREHVPAARRA